VLQTDLAQLDVTDDDFLSLMDDAGNTKDDVKLPDGEVGDKIRKMLDDGKDVSKY
jgi:translation initiation factor 5A